MKNVLDHKVAKILLGLCTWLCVVFVLIISILVILPILPFDNTPRPLVVASGSMEPTIKTGSLVITMPQAINTIKEGSVISFISPNDSKEVILHRVVKITDNAGKLFLTTKGDNNSSEDAWSVPAENVLGKSIVTLPYLGRTVNFMKTPLGFGLIIVIPALAFIFFKITELIQGINEEVEKRMQKKLLQKETQGKNSFKLPVFVLWFTLLGMSVLLMQNAWALFFDSVTVNGVTFETYKRAKTVVMNEFLWKSDCNNPKIHYWIELWNGNEVPVDVNHWRIRDGTGNITNIQDSDLTIQPGGFMLLAKNSTFTPSCEDFVSAKVRNINGNPDFSVEATGGMIYLEKPSSQGGYEVVDTIKYGPDYKDTDLGGSIERYPLGRDSATGTNFDPNDFVIRTRDEKTPGG